MQDRVFYHRAYKKVRTVDTSALVKFFALALLLDVLVVIFHPQITRLISLSAGYALAEAGYNPTLVITDWPLLYRKIYLLDLPASYPTPLLSIALFIFSLLMMLIVPTVKRIPKPISIWFGFLCFINVVSAAFFIFVPHQFPYSTLIFSDLYMKTEIGVWILVPIILAMALHPIPRGITEKFSLILAIEVYSIAFAAIRYAAFLYVFRDYSVIFMAMMFFAFGPLFDFVYVVGAYSLYVSKIAKKLSGDMERWQWLF